MNEDKIKQIKDQIADMVNRLMAVGEAPPDDVIDMLLQVLSKAQAQIEQLRAEGQQTGVEGLAPNTGQAPQLDQGPYPSSNVNAFKYDPRSGTLYVKFHGKDSADSGPTYQYQGVPRNIYDVFSKGRVAPKTSGQNQYHRWIKGVTPSLGASLYALIRNGGFAYQRIS